MSSKQLNNLETINATLDQALAKFDNVVMYGEDVGFEGGVFRATVGLQKKHGEKRIFDAPIAEAVLMGAAIGMALNGMRPIVEFQFAGFSFPALSQLLWHAARFNNRTRGQRPCPLLVLMPMGGGIKALEHHSEAIEAVLAHIPGLTVVIPSTPYDFKGLMAASIESDDPVILFEPSKIYRAFRQDVPDEWYTIPLGTGFIVKPGQDVTLVTYGAQVIDAQKAVAQYEQDHPEVSIEIIDLRTIKPWDFEMVNTSLRKTGRLVVVHEAVKSFSVASEVIAKMNECCFEYLKVPPVRVTGYDITIPYERGEKYFVIDQKRIYDGIDQAVTFQF